MIILDSSNGGYNGVTTDFWTTALSGNKVVRRYFRALQGGYVIPKEDKKDDTDGTLIYIYKKNKYYKIDCDGAIVERAEFVIPMDMLHKTTTSTWLNSGQSFIDNGYSDGLDINFSGHIVRSVCDRSFHFENFNFNIKIYDLLKDDGIGRIFCQYSYAGANPPFGYEYIDEAKRANLGVYENIYSKNIPQLFFVDNVEHLSVEQILAHFKLSRLQQQTRELASLLVKPSSITQARKTFVFLIKNNDQLKVVSYAYHYINGESHVYNETIYTLEENNTFEIFHGFSVRGIVHVSKKYTKTTLQEGGFMKITTDVINPLAVNRYRTSEVERWHVLSGIMELYEKEIPIQNSDKTNQYRNAQHTEYQKWSTEYFPCFVPLSPLSIQYREDLANGNA